MTPTGRSLALTTLLVLLLLLGHFFPWLNELRLPAAALLFLALAFDFLHAWSTPAPQVERSVRSSIPVGVWSKVGLTIHNRSGRSLQLLVHDHHPGDYEVEGIPVTHTIPAERRLEMGYEIRPPGRGKALFPCTDLLVRSPLGLWQRKYRINNPGSSRVLPNFRAISHYALLALDNRLSQIGIKRQQRRGEGNDFYQLREYRAGDSLRQIDWKATSRYRKLIAKEYQDERDQQILFMLDCGRRMRHAEEGGSHMDQALNAMLLLAYVAANQGDAVGFLTFGGASRWQPPRKGGNVIQHLLGETYDIEATTDAADYLEAARQLMPLQRRRSLIVLITNTRDEDSDDLGAAIRLLRQRHLVVVADLREEIIDLAQQQEVTDFPSALRFHGVHDYLQSRERSHEQLRHLGALTLDLLARQLPIALVNEYQMIKASGRL
ncbi:MAG: DUF58 domain-containing protein [Chromatiales bacterium]|nr:DUF58 domain-containing protein [Chromatiales bacterium]